MGNAAGSNAGTSPSAAVGSGVGEAVAVGDARRVGEAGARVGEAGAVVEVGLAGWLVAVALAVGEAVVGLTRTIGSGVVVACFEPPHAASNTETSKQ